MEAASYAGNADRVYSKTVKLDDVAWYDALQGMYADTSKKYSFGTSLNRLDSSKELKAIVGTLQDEYRGLQIDYFASFFSFRL